MNKVKLTEYTLESLKQLVHNNLEEAIKTGRVKAAVMVIEQLGKIKRQSIGHVSREFILEITERGLPKIIGKTEEHTLKFDTLTKQYINRRYLIVWEGDRKAENQVAQVSFTDGRVDYDMSFWHPGDWCGRLEMLGAEATQAEWRRLHQADVKAKLEYALSVNLPLENEDL